MEIAGRQLEKALGVFLEGYKTTVEHVARCPREDN